MPNLLETVAALNAAGKDEDAFENNKIVVFVAKLITDLKSELVKIEDNHIAIVAVMKLIGNKMIEHNLLTKEELTEAWKTKHSKRM